MPSNAARDARRAAARLEQRRADVVFLTFLTRTKRRKMACFEGCPVGWGRVQGLGEGGPRALVPGGYRW